jgi:hypothetical protein
MTSAQTSASQTSASIDVLTVAAIGLTMYIAANVIHEAVGHGGACLLIGGEVTELSTAHLECDYQGAGVAAQKFVSAWAAILNVIFGLVAWGVLRTMKSPGTTVRVAFWAFMGINLMVGTGYPLFSGVIGVGDYANLIEGWEPNILWRVISTLVGIVLYGFTIWLCLTEMIPFIHADGLERVRRATRVSLTIYLAGSLGSSIGAFLNPIGPFVIFTSAAAHFGGTSGLAWMPQLYKSWFKQPSIEGPLVIPRNWVWIGAGAILLAAHIIVLGPTLFFI